MCYQKSLVNIDLPAALGPGKVEAAVQGAEGRAAAAEAGHVRVHRGHRQALRAQAAETEALTPGKQDACTTVSDPDPNSNNANPPAPFCQLCQTLYLKF